jgi:hypothetical protein
MMKFFRYLMPLAAVFMMVACVDNTTPDGPEPEPQPQPQPDQSAELIKAETERDIYKKLYNELLEYVKGLTT